MCASKTAVYPSLTHRIISVWYRHVRVYTKNLLSNGFPTFLEPLLFLAGVGLGLSKYVTESMEGLTYIQFLGTGLLVTASMFTAAFECTYGTFIRLEFEHVYDGMLAAPITVNNLIVGEMLWAGTKGLFFSFSVMVILALFGIVHLPQCLPAPLVGFATGMMFASLSLLVTSFVKTINHFNFYLTGVISPMFFFSGVIFPLSNLIPVLRYIAEALPLTHSVRLVRHICTTDYDVIMIWDLVYIVLFTIIVGILAVHRLQRRLIQ
jgi:lipooligosaccharide transport system permease protein